jgi:hypothetical protein
MLWKTDAFDTPISRAPRRHRMVEQSTERSAMCVCGDVEAGLLTADNSARTRARDKTRVNGAGPSPPPDRQEGQMARNITKLQVQTTVERRILSGEPFTYGGLLGELGSSDEDRSVDRTIQKFRRRGLISFRREGRHVLWTRTADGERAFGELTA